MMNLATVGRSSPWVDSPFPDTRRLSGVPEPHAAIPRRAPNPADLHTWITPQRGTIP